MAEKTLNTIIVLRNDQTTAWEESTYVLDKGELGIGYTADGKVIVKAGIGKTSGKTWKDLPQVEGVFEDNLTLTYAFGKYKPDSTGSFELKTAGKTMSEVMLDAFAQEVYTDLITGNPTASFNITSSGDAKEVGNTHGNPKVTLDLTMTGSYKYGSKNSNGVAEDAKITATKAEIWYNGAVVKQLNSKDPNADLVYELTLSGDALKYKDGTDSYKFTAYANSGADVNRPLTNLGNFVGKDAKGNYFGTKDFTQAIGNIEAKTLLNAVEKIISYRGFRKMFMGISDTDATVANGKLTSDFIRGLTTVSVEATKTYKEFSVAAGKKYFYVAIPESLTTTAPDVYYKPFSNYETFSTVEYLGTVDVEGANSYTAKPYRIYRGFSETGKFESATAIKVTVK
jgi:hypothetical protein